MGMEGVFVPVPEVSSWKHSGNIYMYIRKNMLSNQDIHVERGIRERGRGREIDRQTDRQANRQRRGRDRDKERRKHSQPYLQVLSMLVSPLWLVKKFSRDLNH